MIWEDIRRDADRLLKKIDTLEDLEELICYVEAEYDMRSEEWSNGNK